MRLGIASILVALFIWNPYPFQYLELKGYDTLIMSTEPVQNENILIVDLDEDIVKAYEGYPFTKKSLCGTHYKNKCSSRNYSFNARCRYSWQRE